ncbi:hypothetical protein BKA66DRAFT_452261 [Pyrenochaeta sp. MPI-SDFR-AT-0127]|nr:hypothetical protein BKA66DRAFT_452261 [Pyrenochaeta sp. MPI-SDFR-AT-0127]
MEPPQSSMPVTRLEEQFITENDNSQHDSDAQIIDSSLQFSQSFPFEIDDSCPELSTPITNSADELSIPRDIISSNISRTKLQSELLRPLIAGTYNGLPAYLLKLQFQFQVPGVGRKTFSRIKLASIRITLGDAPDEGDAKGQSSNKSGWKKRAYGTSANVKCPELVEWYPGPEGFNGRIPSAPASSDKVVRIQSHNHGHNGAQTQAQAHSSDIANWNQDVIEEDTSIARVDTMRTGRHREKLIITLTETDNLGIPSFLVVPLIVVHQSRRFSMRVTVNATFGFWCGPLADNIPVLGGADEPLFFDPTVLARFMESEEKGARGEKVVERGEKLEDMDLQLYSSLGNSYT